MNGLPNVFVGLDVSLTGTGIAVYQDGGWGYVGTVRSTARDGGGADPARHKRILRGIFGALYPNGQTPIVMMEGLTLGGVAGNSLADLAGLRALVAYGLVARGFVLVDHVRKPPTVRKGKKVTPPDPRGRGISPTTVKLWATGKGGGTGTDKDAMVIAATRTWPHVAITNNNEADAVWLASMAVHGFGAGSLPYTPSDKQLSALDTIDWPDWSAL